MAAALIYSNMRCSFVAPLEIYSRRVIYLIKGRILRCVYNIFPSMESLPYSFKLIKFISRTLYHTKVNMPDKSFVIPLFCIIILQVISLKIELFWEICKILYILHSLNKYSKKILFNITKSSTTFSPFFIFSLKIIPNLYF